MAESNRKIKIAYFIQDLHTGGAERLLLDLIAHLDAERFDVILITLHNHGELFAHLPAAVRKTYCTTNPFRLYSILKYEKPDVVHTHLWRGDLIGIPIARLAGVKCVVSTRHNVNYFHGLKKILVPWDILAMRMAHKIIAVSKTVRDYYLRNPLYKNVAFGVIPNGVNLQTFSRGHAKTADGITIHILTVASLTRKKGHLFFLEILQRLKDIDYVWHLVGNGPERTKIQHKADQLDLSQKIQFHGIQENTAPFYEHADVFALPSLWEGMPLAIIEAMAAGVPVIASDIETIRETLEDGKMGMLFDVHQPVESAGKIKGFLQDAQQRNAFVECAKQQAMHYSIETMARRYVELYIH